MDPCTFIRELRQRAGVTQAELALMSGVHQPNLSMIENAQRVPTPETVDTLKRALAEMASSRIESLQSVLLEASA